MKHFCNYFLAIIMLPLLSLHVDAASDEKIIVEYCEPHLHPRPGFYMIGSDGEKYTPTGKVYMSQLLWLNKTSEPDYKAWAETPPTEEGYGKAMSYAMALLDQNDTCDCVGTLYLAKLFYHYRPESPDYIALHQENKRSLHAFLFSRKQIVLNALDEAMNMYSGMETNCP